MGNCCRRKGEEEDWIGYWIPPAFAVKIRLEMSQGKEFEEERRMGRRRRWLFYFMVVGLVWCGNGNGDGVPVSLITVLK